MKFSTATFKKLPDLQRGETISPRMKVVGSALLAHGVDHCLEVLNSGVPHRYSGIFRLDNSLLRNTYMFDKLGQDKPQGLQEVVLTDSFCQIAMRDGYLLTDDSGTDARLDYSPYQRQVVAYHGVPIVLPGGEFYGSLCHFDLVQRELADDEFFCLQEAALLLATALKS